MQVPSRRPVEGDEVGRKGKAWVPAVGDDAWGPGVYGWEEVKG